MNIKRDSGHAETPRQIAIAINRPASEDKLQSKLNLSRVVESVAAGD